MKNIFVIFLLLTASKMAFGQQDVQFSQYMFNQMYYNPGYAGIEKKTRLTAIHRVQWLFYEATQYEGGAPQSTILSANTYLKNPGVGLGGFMMYETLGPLQVLDVELTASKLFEVMSGTLGIGVSGGILHQRLDQEYIVVNPNDPIYNELNEGGAAQLNPDLKAGIWYDHPRYYLGASFTHLPRATFSYGAEEISSVLKNHMFVTGGYIFQLGYSLNITPSVLVQTDFNQLTYLFGGMVEYQNKLWFGVNARQSFASRDASVGGKTLNNDDIILYVGINLLKNEKGEDALRLGYAFDFVTSGRDAKTGTSHEIMVSYQLPAPFSTPKPPVWTPRYRQEL